MAAMYRSNSYPFQSQKVNPSKKQRLHAEINEQIIAHFALFDDYIDAETVWLMMKGKGIVMSISSFYNRLKILVATEVISKQANGHNKFIYKLITKQQ